MFYFYQVKASKTRKQNRDSRFSAALGGDASSFALVVKATFGKEYCLDRRVVVGVSPRLGSNGSGFGGILIQAHNVRFYV